MKTRRKLPLFITIVLSILTSVVVLALLGLGTVYAHDSIFSKNFEKNPKFTQENKVGPVTIAADLKENIPIAPVKANITPQCMQVLNNEALYGKAFTNFDWNSESEFESAFFESATNGKCWLKSSGKFQLRVEYTIKNDTWHRKFGLPRDVIIFKANGKTYYPTTYTLQPGTTLNPGAAIHEDLSNFQIPYSAKDGKVYLKWGNYLKEISQ